MSMFVKAVCSAALAASIAGCRQNSTSPSELQGPPPPQLSSLNDQAQWARASDDMLLDSPATLSIDTADLRQPLPRSVAPVTAEQVIRWHRVGTAPEIILDRLQTSQAVFHLTAAEENRLRDAGISEYIIRVMKDTAHRAN